jgi:uncharacterized membrane protein
MQEIVYQLPFKACLILNEFEGRDLVYFFMVYSFMGWILENSFSFLTKRGFFKEGFFWGPFKPMYGFAPLLLLFSITPNTHWLIFSILCLIVPTAVEYASGFLLQKYCHRQWWDYSNLPMQLHGHICMPFSIGWLLLSMICIKFIHPLMITSYQGIESVWKWIYPVALVYLAVELFFALKRHTNKGVRIQKSTNTIQ